MVRAIPVSLACLLILAGCVTPPVVDDLTTSGVQDSDLPPGVTTEGISNASLLLDAHVSALNETGWQERSTVRSRAPHHDFEGVGVTVENDTIAATPGMTEVSYLTDRNRDFPDRLETVTWDRWYDGPTRYTQLTCPSDETVYQVRDSADHRDLLTIQRLPVYGRLQAGDYELNDIDRTDDRTLFTFAADEESAWGRTMNTTFVNGTLVVDSAGRIHRFESTVRWTTDDGIKVTRHDRYELLEIGVSDVESPEWVDTAKRESSSGGCG